MSCGAEEQAGGIEPRAAANAAREPSLGWPLVLFWALLFVATCSEQARAAIVVFPFATSTVTELPTCNTARKGLIRGVTDASSSSSLGAGGGSAAALAQCDGSAWGVVSGGGSGASITLDLGDDGGNDSTALSEIAVTGDTNSIFTESAADKLLIAAGNDWPKADTADDLTCTNCIGGTEIDETALVVGGDGSGSVAALVVADDSHNHGASTLGTDSVSADELNATGVETELEAVLDLDQLQGQIGDAQIADGAVDGGTGGEVADDSLTAADIAADAIGTAELDDDANTPSAGDLVSVETGAASFAYVTPNAGTDVTADLEEETHATEHSLGGGDAITATNLASGCTDAQVLGGTAAGTGVECQADDDVPESGDFGAAGDLEADGTVSANAVALGTDTTNNYVATIADDGQSTITVNNSGSETAAVTLRVVDVVCTGCLSDTELAANSVANSEMADDAIGAAEMADADHGAVAWSSGVATVESIQSGTAFPGSPASGDVFVVTDDSATGECDSAAGSALTICRYNGSSWVAIGDGGGAGGSMPAREFYWTASSLLPAAPADNIPPIALAAATNFDVLYAAFDASADECRSGTLKVPAELDTAGTLTFRVVWDSVDQTSGAVVWDIRHVARTEGEAWDSALTTESAASDTTQGTAGLITITTWTETVSNAGWAAGDEVYFLVCRDGDGTAGTDSMSGDARMHSLAVLIPRAE